MGVLRFNTICINCIYNKFLKSVPDGTDEITRLHYAKGLLKIIAEAPDSVSAPEIVAECTRFKKNTFGFSDDFKELKKHFNALMLEFEPEITKKIAKASDPVRSALCHALLGNYIDFGAMDSVDENKLRELIGNADNLDIDYTEFENLKSELLTAENLVYLTDNCGEVVLDKLFIKELTKQYPNLKIKVLVRGQAVLNDATLHDAEQIGLTEVASVSGNGTDIAGTCLRKMPESTRNIVESADVIIAKGQGNFETLCYCHKNVYYLFMCKCKMFADKFNVPPLSGMLLNDLRMK